jgi:DNA-binding transcriptional LysR family regulator
VDLRELRTFVAVVEEGRFSRAAQRLNLSQPAISHTISGLEKQCGVILLERTAAGVVTTAAGKRLLNEARAVLARFEEAVTAMSGSSEPGAPLRVGIPFGLPCGLLSNALAAMVTTYPATPVAVCQLCSTQQIAALGAGELDLGLLRHRPQNLDLDAVLLTDEPLGVIIGEQPAEALAPSDQVSLDSLAGLNLDWHGFPRDSCPVWFDELTATLRGFGLRVEPPASYTEEQATEVTYASVSMGRSFALAPPSCQRGLPASLRWRRLTGDPLRRRTWAAWPAGSRRRDLGHLVSLLEDAADGSERSDPAAPSAEYVTPKRLPA